MVRARIDLERSTKRTEDLQSLTRSRPRHPVGAPAGDPEVDRDRASRNVDRVDAEGAAQHEPGVVGRAHVHELARP
jgi:hypothetical protein